MLHISIRILRTCLFATAMFASTVVVQAQDDYHRFSFNLGGGFTTAAQNTTHYLDTGGNVEAGAGINVNRWLALDGTFMFNGLGVTRSALTSASMPDGNARVYSFTVDPKIRVRSYHGAAFYVMGGGGWLRRTVQFTQPTIAQTLIFNPWWGYYGPGYVAADQVLGSVSQDTGAWDIGAGFNFGLPRTSLKFYLEARYIEGLTEATHTKLVPISFGLRW